MSGFEKHPILANGEYYITPLEKRIGGGNITRPHEYFEAKQRLLSNIDSIQAEIEKEKEIFVKEKVVCVRLEPKYEAKSNAERLYRRIGFKETGRKNAITNKLDEIEFALT